MRWHDSIASLLLGFMLLATTACSLIDENLLPSFERVVVDADNAGDCKAIGDVDGDGKPDLIVGGRTLVWYRNPDWKRVAIATASDEFTTDCQLADLNGDGRLDLVTADGKADNNVIWFENPGRSATWVRHAIGSHGNWVHDIEVADFDGDGKPDVITHGHGTHLWYQGPSNLWVDHDLSSQDKTKEGVGIGDVDGDGHIDYVQGGWWFANPGSRAAAWTAHAFATGYDGGSFTAAVVDLNGDGRPDIAISEQHKRHEFAWYAAPADPRRGGWVKHVLDTDIGAHKLGAADLDGDGRADLVAGLELAELRIYINSGGPAPTFARKTLNRTGCHNTRLGDVDSDGNVDILCVNFLEHPPIELWLNKRAPTSTAKGWQYLHVDSSRKKLHSGFPALGLAFGDLDRDGLVDIVSGKFFYRNPGSDLTGKWTRTEFPVDTDAMLIVDVDGDGQLDVIAQSLPRVYWLKPNADGSRWTVRLVANLPATTHGNSQGYRLAKFRSDDLLPEIVVAAGDGIWMIRIPASHPERGDWPTTKIASDTSEDLLAVGDIDGDGLDDIVASDAGSGQTISWYRNPGTGKGGWARHAIGEVTDWGDRAEVVDIDGDGRLDLVVSVENGKAEGAATYWFQAPPDSTTTGWTRHTIAIQGSTNSMSVGELGGKLTIATGEHKGQLRLRLWQSADRGKTWQDTLLDSGKESHLGARLVDLDGDGSLDIVSIAWDRFQDLHLWRNDSERTGAINRTPSLSAVNRPP